MKNIIIKFKAIYYRVESLLFKLKEIYVDNKPKKIQSSNNYFILISFLVPVVIYVIYNIPINNLETKINKGDIVTYINIAQNYLNGKGLINTFRETVPVPGYPLLIAFFLNFFNSIHYLILLQYFILGLTGVFIYKLGSELFDRVSSGIISVVLFSVNPVFLFWGPRWAAMEPLYTFMIVITAYLIYRTAHLYQIADISKFKSILLFFVLVLTAGIMVRPHLILILGFTCVIAIYLFIKKVYNIKYLILLLLIPVTVIGYNTYCNYINYKRIIPLSNYSGMALYIANNPKSVVEKYYYTKDLKDNVEGYWFEVEKYDFTTRNSLLMKRAINYMISDPIKTLERTFYRFDKKFFYGNLNEFDRYVTLYFVWGSIFSILLFRQKRFIITLLLLYIVYYSFLTSAGGVQGMQRYRLPIIPVYTIFTGFFADLLIVYLKKIFLSIKNNASYLK